MTSQTASNALFAAALLGLCGANWYWWELVSGSTASGKTSAAETSLIGKRAPALLARSTDGTWRRFDLTTVQHDTVFYVISPECGWCARNTPNITAVATAAKDRFEFIGLFLGADGADDYARAHDLPFQLYTDIGAEFRAAYGMVGTLQTIVVRHGIVVANWIGAYGGGRREEVERFFDVTLPGVLPESGSGVRKDVVCIGANGGIYSPGSTIASGGGRLRCGRSGEWVQVP